jgi:hypothetical protein
MVAGLQDEICQLKGSVNFANITKLGTALDTERSRNNCLSTENYGLYDEIYTLHAAINKRRVNTSCMEKRWSVPRPRTCHLVRPVGRRRQRETILI